MKLARKEKFTDEALWKIALTYKHEFTSVTSWNHFAKEKGLPHSQTFIQRFGKWNELKEKLNVKSNKQHRPQKYERDELITILAAHKGAFRTIHAWNQYANKNKLPSANVFERHLGAEEIERITGYQSQLSEASYKEIILKHFPNSPPTVSQWKNLSKDESDLPSFSTIIRKFDSWEKMKRVVYYYNKDRY